MDNLPSNDGAVWTFDGDDPKYLGLAPRPTGERTRSLLPAATLGLGALPAPTFGRATSLVTHPHGDVDVRGGCEAIHDRPTPEEMVAAHRQMKKELMELEAMMRFSHDMEATLTDEERAAGDKL